MNVHGDRDVFYPGLLIRGSFNARIAHGIDEGRWARTATSNKGSE